MKEILLTILEEFNDILKQDFVKRNVEIPDIKNKATALIGMRRSGKTYALCNHAKKIVQGGVDRNRILFLNFEDDRLLPIDKNKLSSLVDAFYEIFPDNHDKLCYFYFDEIQNVEDYPSVIRRLLDTKKIRLFLTGSSSKSLSKEIATSLRGRAIPIEIWPYDFAEFCSANKVEIPQNKHFGQITLDKIRKVFVEYLRIGGFPEVQNISPQNRLRILQDYINVVIYRDIIERYKITNTYAIKFIIKSLINNSSRLMSINKFLQHIQTQGISISKNTCYDYIGYIEEAFFSFLVPIFSTSFRKANVRPKKIYSIDPGIINAELPSITNQYGLLFENFIYLELRRRGFNVYYYVTKSDYEVDFVIESPQKRYKLLQVAFDMRDKSTLEREKRALIEAEKELGIESEIITCDSFLRNYFSSEFLDI